MVGLTNGTSYTFTVTASNSAGTSPASAASAPAIPATAPGVPTGVDGHVVRQRPVGRVLDGAGVQRWRGHHAATP